MSDPTTALAMATLRDRTPNAYLLSTMLSVRPSDLEEALLLLPYVSVSRLLAHIDTWLEGGGRVVEVACRTLFFLLSEHQHQISLDRDVLPLLLQLNKRAKAALQKNKDILGFNRAALAHMKRVLEYTTSEELFNVEKIKSTNNGKRKHNK